MIEFLPYKQNAIRISCGGQPLNSREILNFYVEAAGFCQQAEPTIFCFARGICAEDRLVIYASHLSECDVYLKTKPKKDWLDKISDEEARLEGLEGKLEEKLEQIKERAREKGRSQAKRLVRKIDRIFTPRRLDPDDAKVIFHPIDYIVFNGMKRLAQIRNLVLLDRKQKSAVARKTQRSIEKAVEKGRYEWRTLKVKEDGSIEEA